MGKNKLLIIIYRHFPVFLFLSFYFVVVSFKLISNPTPFYDWDESINVQVAKEIVEKKSLVPLWQGNPWLDKPPLPFLFFGIIMKLTPFIKPEISLRIISLLLSLISLIFVYAVYLKVETSRRDISTTIIPFLTVLITAFTPIFLQRSQILNLDVFLLIGWLGYLLFVQNFYLGLLFLTISVLTKSLIGFYPAIIMLAFYIFQLFRPLRLRKQTLRRLGKPCRLIRMVFIQIGILSIWYLFMFFLFGKDFWQQHIIETHFRRITSSLESHFGQRTYYVDLMFEQLGIFAWISILGLLFVISSVTRNLVPIKSGRKNYEWILYSFYLLPWFIFLNLTKTKIFWYLYPAIPQFAFLSVYSLKLLSHPLPFLSFPRKPRQTWRKWESSILLNRFRIKYGMTLVGIIIVVYIFHLKFIKTPLSGVKTNFFTTFYSKPEYHYRLALYAKDHCNSLSVLVGKETREATKTLEDLGLTITSTKQWGDHPSIVYYSGKKVNFIYDKNLSSLSKDDCLAIRKDDLDLNWTGKEFKQLKNFNSYYLFKR